jgi:adenylate cyclase
VKIVLGAKTAQAAEGRFATLGLDFIQVKGQSVGVEIHALLGDTDVANDSGFIAIKEIHESMITAYRSQHWDDAEALLKECRSINSLDFDVLYDLYDERIAYYREVPPPIDWDGVYIAKTK